MTKTLKETGEYLKYLSDELSKALIEKDGTYQKILYREYVRTCEEMGLLNPIDKLEKILGIERRYFKKRFSAQKATAESCLSNFKDNLEQEISKPIKIEKNDLIRILNKIEYKN